MVDVYVMNVLNLPDPLEFPECMTGFSLDRIEKTGRYRQVMDRKLSLGAGLLLKKVLSINELSTDDITYGENGKPKIEGIHFNLSHSHEVAVCAVSDQEVGCDVEKIGCIKEKIAERFFSKNEVDYLHSLDEKDRASEFYRIWTMKESYVKMTGEGMSLSLNRFEFMLDDSVRVIRDGKLEDCFLKEYVLPGYKLSVCARESKFSELKVII